MRFGSAMRDLDLAFKDVGMPSRAVRRSPVIVGFHLYKPFEIRRISQTQTRQRCMTKPVCSQTAPADKNYVSHKMPLFTLYKKPSNRLMKCLAVIGVLLLLRVMMPKLSLAAEASSVNESSGNILKKFLDFFLHLDSHLSSIITKYGTATYAILFGIVFCETGLVLTPLLPGDSLLFAAGTMAGLGKLNIGYLFVVFIIAAIVGDAVNYAIGSWLGQKAVNSKFVSKSAIEDTEAFYKKYGGKTIVLARFVPIIRTFAPFVAGVSNMAYRAFAAYNVGGAILWTVLFCGAGYFFGNLPFVEKNFSIVVLGIVIVSILPTLFEIISARHKS